jgi:hypothetical protein
MAADEERHSLAPDGAGGAARAGGFCAVGVAAARLAAPILGKRGGQLARIKAAWPAICGGDWAGFAWPVRLGRDGALKLHVVPAAALELQHRAPHLVARVNLFLGSAVVSRLALVQALSPPASRAAHTPARALSAEETAALEHRLRDIADPELRAALAGLGRAIYTAAPAPPRVAPGSGTR